MRLLLDTSRFLDLRRLGGETLAALAQADTILVPFVLIAEIETGAQRSPRGAHDLELLRRLRRRSQVEVAHSTEATCIHYASLFAYLRRSGTPIPTNDLWIAALVLEHRATLYSSDRHFHHLPQIPRFS